MSRREVLGLVAVLAVVIAAGCGSSSPKGSTVGAGGVRYAWPPPAGTTGFCPLLVDDYQHLKSMVASTPSAGRAAILREFVAFTPTLVASAPPAVAGAAGTYLRAEDAVLVAAIQADFDVATFDRSTLVALSSAPVVAAARQLSAYSAQHCHYDLAAHPALAAPASKGS